MSSKLENKKNLCVCMCNFISKFSNNNKYIYIYIYIYQRYTKRYSFCESNFKLKYNMLLIIQKKKLIKIFEKKIILIKIYSYKKKKVNK